MSILMETDSIITNLKIISLLKINEKLGVHEGHLCINNSSNIQFLRRWFNRDSRKIVIKFIKDLIKDICNLQNITIVKNELEQSLAGLENLKITYSHDLVTVVNLELISMKINVLIT